MKIFLVLGVLLFMIQCSANSENEYEILVIYTSIPLKIDGKPDEAIWKQAKRIVLKENNSGNNVIDPEFTTQVMACYDDSTLYFTFICNDPDIWTTYKKRDDYLWEEEAVEVFIDVDDVPETYVEIEVSPANILFDSYIVDPENIDVPATASFDLPGLRTAVKINGSLNERGDKDSCWTVEIALPFKDLINENTKQITAKTKMRINFFRLDKNRGMKPGSYAWSPTGARFHKPSVFGKLIFN